MGKEESMGAAGRSGRIRKRTPVKKRMRQLFCRHRLYSYGHICRINSRGEIMDTDYTFICPKCGKEKRIHTHGYDFNLNCGLVVGAWGKEDDMDGKEKESDSQREKTECDVQTGDAGEGNPSTG